MAKKLSIRKRGPHRYEIGPAGRGTTAAVMAESKRDALAVGREKLRELQKNPHDANGG